MKILVAVKRVIDPYVKIRVKSDHSEVETQNVKMSMNPFDEIALEEAIRLKEKGVASEIIVVSIGSVQSQETLRHALALGADRAILVSTETQYCSLSVAKILHQMVLRNEPDLVLLGKQSIDGDNNQTPQMLSALLGWPQATYASKLFVDGREIRVTREIDGGLEVLQLKLPAVISTDLRLNEPRYASLPNIMKAKRKPFEQIELTSLGLSLRAHLERISVQPPPARSAGIQVASVKELVDKLKNEAKVL